MKRIIRVFPRRTAATPMDELAYVGGPDLFAMADKIMISVAFTWDIPEAERLEKAWRGVAPVEIGGPAYNEPGGEFTPGLYLRDGYVITSRGCPNRCWFCAVPKREGGTLRELEIKDGWNVLDDNLLACSENHIRAVFKMLKKQKHKARFTGGLEAKILQDWHVELLADIKPKMIYFAYDTPDDYDPLSIASRKLHDAGIRSSSHSIGAYCLIGYPKDTFDKAEKRLNQVMDLGVMPYAMLYRNHEGIIDSEWRKFQRTWARPAIMYAAAVADARRTGRQLGAPIDLTPHVIKLGYGRHDCDDIIMYAAGKAEARSMGRQTGAPIVLVKPEGFDVAKLDYDAALNYQWLLDHPNNGVTIEGGE